MAEAKKGMTPILAGWLILSALLNISGIASIVDGYVVWANFFHDIINVYRTLIREPLSRFIHLILPWWHIPPWIYDTYIVSGGLWIAVNALALETEGRTLFGRLFHKSRNDANIPPVARPFVVLFPFLIWALLTPMLIVISLFIAVTDYGEEGRKTRKLWKYYLVVLATFVLILFVNWQLKRIA